MKITPLQQYIALALIGLVALGVGFYFVLKPLNRDIVTLTAKRDKEQKDLDDAKKVVARYVEFKKRADSVQRELEWIQNRIPKSIDKGKMVEALSLLEDRSGVYLTNYQPSGNTSKDAFIENPVNIKFRCGYKGLMSFLREASLSNLLMTVREVRVTSTTDSDHPDISMDVQMILSGIQAK